MSQRVDDLKANATDERLPQADRDAAVSSLRTLAQGGASGLEYEAARAALAELGLSQEHPPKPPAESLESQLLAKTGAKRLRDVEYPDIQAFCAARNWSKEADKLYRRWIGADFNRIRIVLEKYLALHFGARSTAKHLIENSGKGWPYHNCNAEGVRNFLKTRPACKDAVTVCNEFLEKGRVTTLPDDCDCWKLTRAIEKAYREHNHLVLFHEISQVHSEAEAA